MIAHKLTSLAKRRLMDVTGRSQQSMEHEAVIISAILRGGLIPASPPRPATTRYLSSRQQDRPHRQSQYLANYETAYSYNLVLRNGRVPYPLSRCPVGIMSSGL